jgi:hypothetical protein
MGGGYGEIESMKGIVLGYDTEAEAIVLRADNGRRYRFQAADWRERGSPRKGDPVDFEPDGDRAREVYRVSPTHHLEPATPAAPLSVVADWAPARFFMARPVFSFALLVLLMCLTGAYAVGDVRISLFEVPELISRMSESLDSLIAVSGTDPSPRLGAGVVRVLLILLLGLYAVPVLATITAWREFVGRPNRRLARYAGIAAMVVPIALPLVIALVVQAWVLPGLPDGGVRLGRSGVTTPQQMFEMFRLYATGTILVMLSGFGLWAAAAGRFSIPMDMRTIDEPMLQARRSRPVPAGDPFVPAKKRPAPRPEGHPEGRPDGRPAAPPEAPAAASAPASPVREDVPAGISFLKLGKRKAPPPPSAAPPAAAPPPAASPPGPRESAPPPASPAPVAATTAAASAPAVSQPPPAPPERTAPPPSPPPSPPPGAEQVAREPLTRESASEAARPEQASEQDSDIADDIKAAFASDFLEGALPTEPESAEEELPPRGGSVWPEPLIGPSLRRAQGEQAADTAPSQKESRDTVPEEADEVESQNR